MLTSLAIPTTSRTSPESSYPTSAPLRLTGLVRREFGRSEASLEDGHYIFATDCAAMYGLEIDAELYAASNRNTYTFMCLRACAELNDPSFRPGLIVLAHAVPDIESSQFAGPALAHYLGGDALAFGVGDQGTATGFTALRLAAEYAKSGNVRDVLVMLLDHSSMPNRVKMSEQERPLSDVAIAMTFSTSQAGSGLSVKQVNDVDRRDVPEVLAAQVNAIADTRPRILLAGSGLDVEADQFRNVEQLIRVPAGQPTTGLWSHFEVLDRTLLRDASVVLADYDHALRYLSIAIIDRIDQEVS